MPRVLLNLPDTDEKDGSKLSRYFLNFDTWRKKWEAMAFYDQFWYKAWGETIEFANGELTKKITSGDHMGLHQTALERQKTSTSKGLRRVMEAREKKLENQPNLEELF